MYTSVPGSFSTCSNRGRNAAISSSAFPSFAVTRENNATLGIRALLRDVETGSSPQPDDRARTAFGRYVEDLRPGDVYKHWPGKIITEHDDRLLAGQDAAADRLGLSHAGGGGAPADELAGRRPHRAMLCPGGLVITDEGHLLDTHHEHGQL